MEIILPNNTPENPSVWDTDKSYEEQTETAKDYVCSLFNDIEPIIETDGKRPTIKKFEDVENSIRVTVTTNYRYDIDHRACFVIHNETVILENI